MIRINLIPFRAARKKENVRKQATVFFSSLLVVLLVMGYYNMSLKRQVNQLSDKVEKIKTDLAKAESAAKKVDEVKAQLDIINKKIEVINDLKSRRESAIRLLDDMTRMVAENVEPSVAEASGPASREPVKRLWFTNFSASGSSLNIKGIAVDNKTVADFMTRLETSKLFANVNLQTLAQAAIKDVNLKRFEITCDRVSEKKEENPKK